MSINLDEVHSSRARTISKVNKMVDVLGYLQEVRLSTTNADRERYDELATLYGIIVSLDYLEKAYVRDSITQTQCVLLMSITALPLVEACLGD